MCTITVQGAFDETDWGIGTDEADFVAMTSVSLTERVEKAEGADAEDCAGAETLRGARAGAFPEVFRGKGQGRACRTHKISLPGQYESRAAHALECDQRLLRDPLERAVWPDGG